MIKILIMNEESLRKQSCSSHCPRVSATRASDVTIVLNVVNRIVVSGMYAIRYSCLGNFPIFFHFFDAFPKLLLQGCTSCASCQPGCEKMERELENEEEMERE